MWPYYRIVSINRFNSRGSSESLVNLKSLHGRRMKKGGGRGEENCMPASSSSSDACHSGRHCTHCEVAMIVSI